MASCDPKLTVRFVNDMFPFLNRLHGRARRMTPEAVAAEDLLQETVLRAYADFDTLAEGADVWAWLFRIMTNTYVNGLHRAQHRPSEYLTDLRLADPARHCSRGPRWPDSMQWLQRPTSTPTTRW
ncbi:hypothetical protein ASG82_18800 [Mycobacterium sp. Soil538]|nr:hypothetical protein ASG82_18800 [Mycobacterium sp. Soil538]